MSCWFDLFLTFLAGKKYKTKKERLRFEKEGPPYAPDGSLDYAQSARSNPSRCLPVLTLPPPSRRSLFSIRITGPTIAISTPAHPAVSTAKRQSIPTSSVSISITIPGQTFTVCYTRACSSTVTMALCCPLPVRKCSRLPYRGRREISTSETQVHDIQTKTQALDRFTRWRCGLVFSQE